MLFCLSIRSGKRRKTLVVAAFQGKPSKLWNRLNHDENKVGFPCSDRLLTFSCHFGISAALPGPVFACRQSARE